MVAVLRGNDIEIEWRLGFEDFSYKTGDLMVYCGRTEIHPSYVVKDGILTAVVQGNNLPFGVYSMVFNYTSEDGRVRRRKISEAFYVTEDEKAEVEGKVVSDSTAYGRTLYSLTDVLSNPANDGVEGAMEGYVLRYVNGTWRGAPLQDIDVEGGGSFGDNVVVKGTLTTTDLDVLGNENVNGNQTVKGGTHLSGTLHVEKTSEFRSSTTFEKDITVKGIGEFKDLNAQDVHAGRLESDGDAIFHENLTVQKDFTVDGKAEVKETLTAGGITTHGDATVGGDASVNGTILSNGLEIGKFIEEGDIIQGAQVTKEGVGSFAGLKSPYMQIYELILNRKTAVQGEFAFSDGDTVEGVTLNEGGTYTLALREEYKGYRTSFKKDDIVYANVNIIGGSDYSDDSDYGDDSDNSSNSSYRGVTTGKCWMRVNGVAEDGLSLNVALYSDDQVPSKKNILPQPYMMITRHGNETDKSRQDVWIISSEDGRMYMLTGVDSPIINTATAYATVWGKLPQNLVEYIQQHVTNFNPNQPYLYARGAVIQDLILLNYKGAIIKTENYRGAWSYETAVNDPYITNETTYDTVTHNGSKWMVQASGTTVEPSETVTEWTVVTAKGETGVSYSLKPSPSTVQVYKNQVKSVLSLDVTVVESGEDIIELTEQDELDARGLKVQFALDGQGKRYDLEIGGVYAIEDESGEAVFVDETYDGEDDILYFEGEAIDLNQVQDNITIYLVKNGKDIAEQRVPVVKDGKDGINGKDGTSIKIAGEFESEEALNAAFPEGDGENCYLIGTDVWVWDGKKWINAGQFKGDGAVRIDLDNQTDTMIYDNDGKLLSGEVTSNIRLYDGHGLVENATFTLHEPTDVTAYVEGDVLRITGCHESQGYAQVACEYRGTTYYATMTVKKIVNGARYEIVTNPTSVTYNETKDELSHNTVSIEIYRSAQDATGKFVREKLSTLPYGHLVAVLPSTGGSLTVDYNSGATVTVDKSWEYFTVLFVDDYKTARLDEETVPVIRVKDGDNGENGHSYTLQASVSSISQLVDAETGMTMTNEEEEVTLVYVIDGVPQPLDGVKNFISVTPSAAEDISVTFIPTTNGTFKANIKLKKDKTPTTKNLRFRIESMEGLPTVSTDIAISHPQRGLVGPAGETGAMLYPAGYWDANTVYTQVKDEEGKAVATPFVYYQNQQGAGDYYVLQRDLPNAGIDPSTDDSETYWKKFQPIQYLFTEALMANWARLAKSVFWGDYMFSTKGVNQAGEVVDHTAYMGTDNPMFDSETNRLTGTLIPNLFLDLENGLVKTNKLSETFRPFRESYTIPNEITSLPLVTEAISDILSLETSYNIKCEEGRKVLMMPLLTDIKSENGNTAIKADTLDVDGVHSVVSVFPSIEYETLINGSILSIGNNSTPELSYEAAVKRCTILCADPRIFAITSYKYGLAGHATEWVYAPSNVVYNQLTYYENDMDMFFSIGGTLTKWLLLEAGTTVNLRLIESNNKHIWIVENASDFEQLDVRIGMTFPDSLLWITGGVIGYGNSDSPDTNAALGKTRLERLYGSKRLRLLYDYAKTTAEINIQIDVNDYANNTNTTEIADGIMNIY